MEKVGEEAFWEAIPTEVKATRPQMESWIQLARDDREGSGKDVF